MSPDGVLLRRYERSLSRLLAAFDYAQVVYNRRHQGRLSGAPRHVQVMIYGAVANLPITVAVECRQQHRPVGISCVDYFVAKLEDVGADRGILYSCAGFTGPAARRAARSYDPAIFAISFADPAEAAGPPDLAGRADPGRAHPDGRPHRTGPPAALDEARPIDPTRLIPRPRRPRDEPTPPPATRHAHAEPRPPAARNGPAARTNLADRIDELAYASFLRYPAGCDRN